jgi:hypothetical protein
MCEKEGIDITRQMDRKSTSGLVSKPSGYSQGEANHRVLSAQIESSLSHSAMIQMQRTYGNRKVGQLLAQRSQTVQRRDQSTAVGSGLPDQLKSGVEASSGMDLSNVNVHYNSDKPRELQALAYAEENNIHLSPGQEKHLPHEAWHVVQQRQGRVKPGFEFGGATINNDPALELEADHEGEKAASMTAATVEPAGTVQMMSHASQAATESRPVAQLSNAVDVVLGMGSFNVITQALAANGRNYNSARVLESAALDLTGAGLAAPIALNLLVALIGAIDREAVLARAAGYAAQMLQNNVPVATVTSISTLHPDLALSQQRTGDVIQLATTLHGQGWAYADMGALLTAFSANANNLTIPQWTTIAANFPAGRSADAIAFSRIPNWNGFHSNALAAAFVANANNLTFAEWATIAGHTGNNQSANAIGFARINGWGAAAIGTVAQAYVANQNGLTGAEWATIAGSVNNDAHADVIALARLAGWNPVPILALAAHFGTDDYGQTSATWAALAARRVNDDDYIRRLVHYVGQGWPTQINFNGGVALLGLVRDGVMYGTGNPHVTIHGVDEGDSIDTWKGRREYHIQMGGGANTYDFVRDQDSFFNNVNRANIPQARLHAQDFRNEMGI